MISDENRCDKDRFCRCTLVLETLSRGTINHNVALTVMIYVLSCWKEIPH